MTYPDDCLQSIISPDEWWVRNEAKQLCRGALIFAFVPHVDQVPYTFEPIGRSNSEQHGKADVRVAPLKVDQPLRQTELPVAAMSLNPGEVWAAYRAKVRPCLVIGKESPSVEKRLTRGKPNHSTAPTVLVAPYYGVDQVRRAGYSPAFVERVRHCEYPQFLWDQLPTTGTKSPRESILRLDHQQPIGTHRNSFRVSDFRLSKEALFEIVDELVSWLVRGGLDESSLLAAC